MIKRIHTKNYEFIIHQAFYNNNIKHVFTTKPMAMGPFRNLDKDDLQSNYDLIKELLKVEGSLYFMKQQHTNKVIDINKVELVSNHLGSYIEGVDGLITNQPNQLLISTYADCIPILIHDPIKKIQVNIHAGWKGVYSGILDNALKILINDYQSHPHDLKVLFGPHLLVDDFEVQQDVYQLFIEKFPQITNLVKTQDSRIFIDLNRVHDFYCQQNGLLANNIYNINLSTLQDESLHSFRKDKEKFQQMALVSVLLD